MGVLGRISESEIETPYDDSLFDEAGILEEIRDYASTIWEESLKRECGTRAILTAARAGTYAEEKRRMLTGEALEAWERVLDKIDNKGPLIIVNWLLSMGKKPSDNLTNDEFAQLKSNVKGCLITKLGTKTNRDKTLDNILGIGTKEIFSSLLEEYLLEIRPGDNFENPFAEWQTDLEFFFTLFELPESYYDSPYISFYLLKLGEAGAMKPEVKNIANEYCKIGGVNEVVQESKIERYIKKFHQDIAIKVANLKLEEIASMSFLQRKIVFLLWEMTGLYRKAMKSRDKGTLGYYELIYSQKK